MDEVQIVATPIRQYPDTAGGHYRVSAGWDITGLQIPGAEPEEASLPTRRRLFEPSPEAVLGYLLGHYLNIYIYFVLLNAKASEQSARMVSMKNATDSAEA